jgi:hypothetical protein
MIALLKIQFYNGFHKDTISKVNESYYLSLYIKGGCL